MGDPWTMTDQIAYDDMVLVSRVQLVNWSLVIGWWAEERFG